MLSFRPMLIRPLVVVCAVVIGLNGSAAAQAPADQNPPIRIGQVLLTGYIHFDYRAELGDVPDREQTFRVRRARLHLSGPLAKDIDWAVSADVAGGPVLRDAYVRLRYLPAATIRLGQLIMPYSFERYVASSNTLEFTERVLLHLAPGRDAGVMVSNERPFFGWLSYGAAIVNGTGQNVTDDNAAKDTMLRVAVSPPRLAGLQVGVNAARGDQPTGMRTRSGADIHFENRAYRVAAEFLRENSEDGGTRQDGLYAMASWRIYPKASQRMLHHVELAARFTRITTPVAPESHWDLAANYYVHRSLRIMCDVLVPSGRHPGPTGNAIHTRVNLRF